MITILCFSKDRPLQLEGYLSSLAASAGVDLPTAVLYAAGPEYRQAYAQLAKQFPRVTFIAEQNFKQQVMDFVNQASTPLFMWGCDDVVFKQPWEPRVIEKTFISFTKLMCFSLRLGQEINFCHPANLSERLPTFLASTPFLLWRWTEGEVDWGYPWELDCTIYPTMLIKSILQAMKDLDWGHPNRLEGLGVHVVRQLPENNLMACYPEARASVVTVNRVQEVVANRVYQNELSTSELLQRWQQGQRLDVERYRQQRYSSIHIGDLFLR